MTLTINRLLQKWRLPCVALLLLFYTIPASGAKAQDEPKVNLDFKNVLVTKIFATIEAQTDFKFTYNKKQVAGIRVERISFKGEQLKTVLGYLEAKADLEFMVVNKSIGVKVKAVPAKRSNNPEINDQPKKQLTDVTISGKVSDAVNGEVLIGATVQVKGTDIGTQTDTEGEYNLTIPGDASILVISYIGYEPLEVAVNNRNVIDFTLKPVSSALTEVVVIGYTTQKVADLTGAVGVVNVDKIRNLPVNGIEQALQGQVAGVQVSTDGAPGGGVAVRIRGYSSIGNNDPLYVIDGVPTQSGLNQFNLNDVESIQVLKDASSVAIYGARAANGVVIITTKKGRKNNNSISFDSYVGTQTATNLPTMLNAEQFGTLLWQAQRNAGIKPSNLVYGAGDQPVIPAFIDAAKTLPAGNTDWFTELFDPAPQQSYTLSVESGSDKARSLISASYLKQDGVIVNSGFNRLNLRVNSEFTPNKYIRVGENLSISNSQTVSTPNSDVVSGLVALAYQMPAIVPLTANNGNFGGPVNGLGDARNPVASAFYNQDDKQKLTRIFGNVFAELEVVKNLILKSDFGMDYNVFNFKNFDPRFQTGILSNTVSALTQTSSTEFNWVWNNTLRYQQSFGKNNFSILLGSESIRNTFDQFSAARSNFLIDNLDYVYLNSGEGQQTNSGSGSRWSLFSYFARADYSFNNKYLFSASLRRDGSSRFSSNNRYAIFPAGSLGWRISEESFFKNVTFINDLKFRVSWGQSGNQEIGNYASYTNFATRSNNTNYDITGSNNSVATGFALDQLGNAYVKWETTTQTNVGIDAKLFKRSLSLSFDYFIKTTDDILVQKQTLAIEGQSTPPFINAGKMENRGFELQLNYQSKDFGDFHFEVGGNLSAFKNEVISLSKEIDFLTGTISNNSTRNLTISRTAAGQPIGQFYGHIAEGLFKTQAEVDAHATQAGKGLGRLKYKDLNGDKIITNDDRTYIGSPHPDFIYGFNLGLHYKNFDLSAFFQGVAGNKLYNLMRFNTDFFYDPFNKSAKLIDAWSTENPNSNIPAVSTVNPNNELRPSTYFVEDGSFLRLKNVQLGYTFSFAKLGVQRLRLYVQAQNLLTFTKYTGLDPEVSLRSFSSGNRNLDIGIDRGIYPNAKTMLVGVNVQF